ncbi:MAG: hypothetical protein JXM73_13395 [Anaerolineae bacterium]|nr:hypothetical protein [Anaerolineae bacterium]
MNTRQLYVSLTLALALALAAGLGLAVEPQPGGALTTAFTYQGRLTDDSGRPVDDTCAFQFSLWDDATAGSQVGPLLNPTGAVVTKGLFTVQLDFGAVFDGTALWLEVAVQCSGDPGYTTLDPRQALTAAPHALYAVASPWSGLTGVPAGFADGVDDDTTYTAGAGLVLTGTQFSVTGAPWSGLTGVPAGFADGVDNDTTYTAGAGLVLTGTTFLADTGYLDARYALVDHTHSGSEYANVVIVAKGGGDYTSVQAALDSITDNSSGNRYLVWIAPGIYAEAVTMKLWVDIEGAGKLATKITATGSYTWTTGTVIGADNAELRFLTVENTGGGQYAATAIYNRGVSPSLTHVTALASGGAFINVGVRNHDGASPLMQQITASGAGGSYNFGVVNYLNSSPTMLGVIASSWGGVGDGTNYGVENYINCNPLMMNVVAAAQGNYSNRGVANYASSPTMMNVKASGSGGGFYNDGVDNYSSAPLMQNVVATGLGTGGLYGIGVLNVDSSPTLNDVTAVGSGGGLSSWGLDNRVDSGTYTVRVNNCQISGSTNTIRNGAGTTFVGGSLLNGGAVTNPGGGTVVCAGVWDESYTFYPSTCP